MSKYFEGIKLKPVSFFTPSLKSTESTGSCGMKNRFMVTLMHLPDAFIQSDLQCINGAFPLHGTARYGSLLGGFPLGTVPGT